MRKGNVSLLAEVTLVLLSVLAVSARSDTIYTDDFNRTTLGPDWTLYGTADAQIVNDSEFQVNGGNVYYNAATVGESDSNVYSYETQVVDLGGGSNHLFYSLNWFRPDDPGTPEDELMYMFTEYVRTGTYVRIQGYSAATGEISSRVAWLESGPNAPMYMQIDVDHDTMATVVTAYTDSTKSSVLFSETYDDASLQQFYGQGAGYVGYRMHDDTGHVDMRVDNFKLTVAPEPSTMALLTLGGVTLLRRRRK